MGGNQKVLHVHPGPHFGGTAHENAHLSGAHLGEQLLFFDFGIGVVDERNFTSGNPLHDELISNVRVNAERFRRVSLRCSVLESVEFRTARELPTGPNCPVLFRGGAALGSGNIAENKLRQLFVLPVVPELENVVDAHVDLAVGIVGKHGIDNALIETELASVRCNLEHVVHGRIDDTGMDGCGTLRKLFYHLLLNLRGLRDFVVVHSFRRWKVELVGGLDVRRFLKQRH